MASSAQSLLVRRKLFMRLLSTSSIEKIKCYDVAVVGGGIVGVAAAREILKRKPHLKCAVLEKENGLAQHQSGNNSGVVHAGIYYTPGSMRALLCKKGMDMAYEYMDARGIAYKKVGKLIVATDEEELSRLETLYKKGLANEVKDLRIVEAQEIQEIEPHCKGLRAIHSPHTGVVDWGIFTKQLGSDFRELGGTVHLQFELSKLAYGQATSNSPDSSEYPVNLISTNQEKVYARYVLCCAGLHADRVAELSGGKRNPVILPVRGEFLELVEEKRHLVKGNIYPVPDPKFPFLGVHFTPRPDGRILVGPNAVVAFKREGYKYTDVSLADCIDYLGYSGFRRLAFKHFQYGMQEFAKSVFLNLQLKKLQKFIPKVTAKDLKRGPTGVRAQALSSEGDLVEDFVFESGGDGNSRILHCRNAPSPAATSSLAIAEVLADKMFELMSCEKVVKIT